jgi:hypothetical protein
VKYKMNPAAGYAPAAARHFLLAAAIESALLASAWLLSGLSDTLL